MPRTSWTMGVAAASALLCVPGSAFATGDEYVPKPATVNVCALMVNDDIRRSFSFDLIPEGRDSGKVLGIGAAGDRGKQQCLPESVPLASGRWTIKVENRKDSKGKLESWVSKIVQKGPAKTSRTIKLSDKQQRAAFATHSFVVRENHLTTLVLYLKKR